MPDGFLGRVYETVRKHKGVCIADEVQAGFGRLGTHFWGCLERGGTPDIMTMAKSIGNGYPMAALVTTKKIADSLGGKKFFSSFGADPIGCTVAL